MKTIYVFILMLSSVLTFKAFAQPNGTLKLFDKEVVDHIEFNENQKKVWFLSQFADLDFSHNYHTGFAISEMVGSGIIFAIGTSFETSPKFSYRKWSKRFQIFSFFVAGQAITRFYLGYNDKDAGVSPFAILGKKTASTICELHDDFISDNSTTGSELMAGSLIGTLGLSTFVLNHIEDLDDLNQLKSLKKINRMKKGRIFGAVATLYGVYLIADALKRFESGQLVDNQADYSDKGKLYALRIDEQSEVEELESCEILVE